jgi:hypothetical protein
MGILIRLSPYHSSKSHDNFVILGTYLVANDPLLIKLQILR